MKKMLIVLFLVMLVSVGAFAQWMTYYDMFGTVVAWVMEYLEDDSNFDGCTFSPDGMFINGRYINWRSACNQHDEDYQKGVNKDVADKKLRDNMIRAGAPRTVAEAYYLGVQRFGQSFYDDAQKDKKEAKRGSNGYSLPSDNPWNF